MKRAKKIIITAMLSLLFCLKPVTFAKASIAGEAALLAQQIAQFVQDLYLDLKKWEDVARRLREVTHMAKTISKGVQAYTSINNIANSSMKIVNVGKRLDKFSNYPKQYGRIGHIEHSIRIMENYLRRADVFLKEVRRTLLSFDRLTDLKPLEMLDAVDKATGSFSNAIDEMSENAIYESISVCQEVVVEQVVDGNEKFLKLSIY